jgi:hypothetical protein
MWLVYFIYMYENRTMKLVEIDEEGKENIGGGRGGVNLTKVHCKHIWECDNETCTTNTCL